MLHVFSDGTYNGNRGEGRGSDSSQTDADEDFSSYAGAQIHKVPQPNI